MSTSLMQAEISTVVSFQSLYRSNKVQAVHCDMPFCTHPNIYGCVKTAHDRCPLNRTVSRETSVVESRSEMIQL